MMNKYYVTCGQHDFLCHAANPLHACMEMFFKYFSQDEIYLETIGPIFRVSERGFEQHEDDRRWETEVIMRLAILSNEFEGAECE